MAKSDPTPIESFLAPLARITHKSPGIEGLVFWGDADGWHPSPSEALESEEVVFYAEGLLLDGFHMDWALIEDAEGLTRDLRLCFWQEGDAPPPPLKGWDVLETGRWTSSASSSGNVV